MYAHSPFPNLVYALDLNNDGKILWKYEPTGSERDSGHVLRHRQSRPLLSNTHPIVTARLFETETEPCVAKSFRDTIDWSFRHITVARAPQMGLCECDGLGE
jgi:hypothetical protein